MNRTNTDRSLFPEIDPALDRELERTLRELDPADAELSAAQRADKDALLASILGTEAPRAGTATRTARTASHTARAPRRHPARWAVPLGAAAALTGAFVLANGVGGSSPAYASWTAKPQPVVGDALAGSEKACSAQLAQSAEPVPGVPADQQPAIDLDSARTVVAEQRGDYLLVAMATDDGSDIQCFFDAAHPDRPTAVSASTSTVSSEPLAALSPDTVEMLGPGSTEGPEGTYAVAVGRVGADVTGVTLHAADLTIEASVEDGHLAAWWPTEDIGAAGIGPSITADVHLADGTTRTDVTTDASHAEPGPREIAEVYLGGGVGEDGEVETASGLVGEDVTAVTVVLPDGERAEAELDGGEFWAEWPARHDVGAGGDTTVSSDGITFDLTLSDGTTRTGVTPEGFGD